MYWLAVVNGLSSFIIDLVLSDFYFPRTIDKNEHKNITAVVLAQKRPVKHLSS